MQLSYRVVLKRALAAGLAAGCLLAAYSYLLVEPRIDDAIAIEDARAAAAPATAAPMHVHFSRSTQVGGGMAAALIYGALAAVIFGTVFARIRHRLPDWPEHARVLWLAAVTFGAIGLVPAIKYPANPPAVGNPDTVDQRTIQYVVLLALSIALAIALTRLSGWLRNKVDGATRVAIVAAATAIGYGIVLVAMPGTPDAIDASVPARLIWEFRLRSLGGLALLWGAVGLGLGWALERAVALRPAREPALTR